MIRSFKEGRRLSALFEYNRTAEGCRCCDGDESNCIKGCGCGGRGGSLGGCGGYLYFLGGKGDIVILGSFVLGGVVLMLGADNAAGACAGEF